MRRSSRRSRSEEHTSELQSLTHLVSLAPFIKGFTVFYWATGTWWIPMLLALGVWRHVVARYPLRYDPLYWGAVFPLGMYTACTYVMAHALDLAFLYPFVPWFAGVAFLAWTVTFLGLVSSLSRSRGARPPQP